MKKQILTTSVAIILMIGAVWIIVFTKDVSKNTPLEKDKQDTARRHTLKDAEQARKSTRSNNKKQTNVENVDFVKIPDFNQKEHKIIKSDRRYSRYVGASSRVKITNSDGLVLYQASPENPFVRVVSMDGGDKIGISRGDHSFRVIDIKTAKFIDLPVKPNLNKVVGFGYWDWVNSNLLIGVSGIEKEPDQTLACCDEHTVLRSLLYVYDISKEKMRAVNLPPEIEEKVFTVNQVTTDGFIELVSSSGHEDDGQPLGWFKIDQ